MSSSTDFGVTQLEVIYFPMFYKEKRLRESIENMIWYSPMLRKDKEFSWNWSDESIDRHFMELKNDHQKLAYPIVAWSIEGICGYGNDGYAGSLGHELVYLGSDELFHEKEMLIYKIAMPHFRRHPDTFEKRIRGYRKKLVPLNKLRKPLVINLPVVWSCWHSYDDYSGEADAEFWPIGELNTVRLDTILIDGGIE